MANRFRILSTGIAFGAAMGLGTAFAPSATAAPSDVTLTPVVDGNTVSASIANNSPHRVACEIFGVPAGGSPSGQVVFGYVSPESLGELIPRGATQAVDLRLSEGDSPTGPTAIPNGSYDLYWGCTSVLIGVDGVSFGEQWGTAPPVGATPTVSAPVRVNVTGEPAPDAPGDPTNPSDPPAPGAPEDICVSSLCAPVPELPAIPGL